MIHRRISSIWSPWVAEIRSNLTTLTGCEKRSVISSCDHAHPRHTSFATSLGPHESASMSGIWVNSSILAGLIGVPSTKTSLRYDICTNRLHRFMIVALAMRPNNSTHTHPFNGPFSGTTQVGRYQKGKPIWILLKQETVSGSGISWAVCKSAPRSRQITTPAPHHSVFYRPDALPAAQPTASKRWRQ